MDSAVRQVSEEWREVAPPGQPGRFFAPEAGVPPSSGTPTVGGIRLPEGSRCPRHWATDLPVPGALALAVRLAEAFPETGLWPMLWEFPESPDHYLYGAGDPSGAQRIDVAAVMRRLTRLYGLREDFPGLAQPPPDADVSADPFGTLERAGLAPRAAYLVLVPAHRPSDMMGVAGFGGTVVMRDEELAAVLLSWEERFQAIPTVLGPGTLTLAVGAPPASAESARRLAQEVVLVAPATAEPLARLARGLRFGSPSTTLPSRNIWPLGWPD